MSSPAPWHIAWVGIGGAISTAAAAKLVRRVSIRHATTTPPLPWLVTGIGIGWACAAPAARFSPAIAGHVTRVGIGLTAPARLLSRGSFTTGAFFWCRGFAALRQGLNCGYAKPRPR